MKALLRFPYDLVRAIADGVHQGLEICYPMQHMPSLDELELMNREAETEVTEPKHCGCFTRERFEELLDEVFTHRDNLAHSSAAAHFPDAAPESPEPEPVSADQTGSGHQNLTPAELRTVVDSLQNFRDLFVPSSTHWNAITELYDRLRTAAI